MMDLTQLAKIFKECRFDKERDADQDIVFADGLTGPRSFSSVQLNEENGRIVTMLAQLPEEFHHIGGSLAEAYEAIHGRSPRKLPTISDNDPLNQLILLGLAIGKIKKLYARVDQWTSLPEDTLVFRVRA